jgi:hypothetical protein
MWAHFSRSNASTLNIIERRNFKNESCVLAVAASHLPQ